MKAFDGDVITITNFGTLAIESHACQAKEQ